MNGTELKHFLEQYLAETISEEQFQKLWSSLHVRENEADWEAIIDELFANQSLHGLSEAKTEQAALVALREKVREMATPPVRKRVQLHPYLRWTAAAAVLIALGLGGYLLFNTREKTISTGLVKQFPASEDREPGGEKAILTLADGSTIVLDTANNGTLASQGNTRVTKLSNGQLAYNAQGKGQGKVVWNTMTTPRGGQYRLLLADGTQVWLNAASSISFPAEFTGSERRVRVTGEVYFEVAKKTAQPFFVDVNGQSTIRVLGTHFNVNSYADEGSINTTLLEGKIQISRNNEQRVMKPGQQVQVPVSPGTPQMRVVEHADLDEVMAWKNGTFQFNQTSLAVVMRQVERWYDVEVVYDKDAPNIRLGGEIKRDLKLSQLLEGLGVMGVKFEIRGKQLLITK